MSTINKIEVSGVTYDIEDSTARSQSGLTNEAKQALLTCFQKVAWIDANGQTYYDALETALYPPANLVSISATYIQSGDVYTTDSLEVLRPDLTVTGTFDDQSTRSITAYTLSGTLTEGTSTITVLYGGKTTTFTVVVSIKDTRELLYKWDFTKSLTDSVSNAEMVLASSNSGTLPTRDSGGLHFTDACQIAYCDGYSGGFCRGLSYEMDIASASFAGTSSNHKRLLMFGSSLNVGGMIFRNNGPLQVYKASWYAYTAESGKTIPTSMDDLSGHTVKIYLASDRNVYLYIDKVLIGTITAWQSQDNSFAGIGIGGDKTGAQSTGNQIHNCVITALRVYNEEAV